MMLVVEVGVVQVSMLSLEPMRKMVEEGLERKLVHPMFWKRFEEVEVERHRLSLSQLETGI